MNNNLDNRNVSLDNGNLSLDNGNISLDNGNLSLDNENDPYLNSNEFQQLLHNSIIDNLPTNKLKSNVNNNIYINNLCTKKDEILTDNQITSNLKLEQNNSYNESLKIDKARLMVAKILQNRYKKWKIKKEKSIKKKYINYVDYQKKRGKYIKNKDNLSWMSDYTEILKREHIRIIRLKKLSN